LEKVKLVSKKTEKKRVAQMSNPQEKKEVPRRVQFTSTYSQRPHPKLRYLACSRNETVSRLSRTEFRNHSCRSARRVLMGRLYHHQ
jgi:hypothetical protein